MRIMNLTQHSMTKEQLNGNEVFRKEAVPGDIVCNRLTFNTLPSEEEMQDRALELARIAAQHSVEGAVVGGAPYFMPYLEKALIKLNIIPLYSFSIRKSVEVNKNGTVMKTSIFEHIGWIKGSPNNYEGY